MTISSEISKLQTNLSNAYSAAEAKGATLPASQNFDNLSTTINSINVETITVDQTYDATSTNAQSGTAVAEAVSSKQDTLVSGSSIKTINGNSLLGSGNIAIETNTDDETISYNSSDALQVIAVKNKRDDSTLPIWHGTEYQWNHGVPTTWYYWQTSVTAMWIIGGALQNSYGWQSPEYGNNKFIIISETKSAYSTDGGETWTAGGDLPESYSGGWQSPEYGNGKLVTVPTGGIAGKTTAYSDDDGITWQYGGNLPSSSKSWIKPIYVNGRFITITSNLCAYSDDGGETWTAGGNLSNDANNWISPAYGNGRLISVKYNSADTVYSDDGGETWIAGGNLPSSNTWRAVSYGDGKFVTIANTKSAYSTDGGETWIAGGNLPSSGTWQRIAYGDGKFVTIAGNSNKSAYSTDGINWTASTLPSSGYWEPPAFGNGKFIAIKNNSTDTAIFTLAYDKCYTDTANPTTSSVVYSSPETTSTKTISSVGSGTITLSDNLVYNSTPSGNQNTYRTIGDAHPEYLAFIDGVGVKMGNTLIASATPITTTITSTSTDTEVPSAKAVYNVTNSVTLTVNLSFVSGSISNGSFKFVIDGNTYTFSDFTNNQMTIKIPSNSNISWEAEYSGKSLAWSDGTNSGSGTTSNGTLVATDDVTLTFTFKYTSDYGSGDEPS